MSFHRSLPLRALKSSAIKDARGVKCNPNLEDDSVKRDQTGFKATFMVVVSEASPPPYHTAVHEAVPTPKYTWQPPTSHALRLKPTHSQSNKDRKRIILQKKKSDKCHALSDDNILHLLRIAIKRMDVEAAAAVKIVESNTSTEVFNAAEPLEQEQDEAVGCSCTDDILDVMYGFLEDGAPIHWR